MTNETSEIRDVAIAWTLLARAKGSHLCQLIALTGGMGLALCSGAQAITWQVLDGTVGGSSWYIPKLAGDGNGNFVVVGEEDSNSAFAPLQSMTGVFGGSGIGWNVISEYSLVQAPSVALAVAPKTSGADFAVEVHQGGQDNGSALWYRTALSTDNLLPWSSAVQYDTGFHPSVAIDTSSQSSPTDVVEVHQSASEISDLWYHVGKLRVNKEGKVTLTWGPAHQFDYGYLPSVSVSSERAVEVHEGLYGELWYSIGTISGDKIDWATSSQYGAGYNPSVALTVFGLTGSYVYEVHQAGNPSAGESTGLWYQIANWVTTVTWSPAVQYDNGCSPTMAFTAENLVETHTGACGGAYPLYYDVGY